MIRPTKDQIRELPLYQGVDMSNIIVVTNKEEAQAAVSELTQYSVIGFDTESKPTFKKGEVSSGPHLIQLSCLSKTFIFPTIFPVAIAEVGQVLSNPDIKKVGFGLADDKKIILQKFGIKVENALELSSKVQKFTGVKQKVGARVAVAMLFGQRLSKGAQTSNWAAFPLQEHQLKYAANDSYSALCVEIEIEALKIKHV